MEALLVSRGVVKVVGEGAAPFLQGLLTADVDHLGEGEAAYAALLTPQGKIVVDFMVVRVAEAFFLDVKRVLAADLARKLNFYKLRARVMVEDISDILTVKWRPLPAGGGAGWFADPRHAGLGARAFVTRPLDQVPDETAYHALRIALAVPEGGEDFVLGDAFPHEAAMDQLHGVSFEKGCYVGQEVVSRMQHRGTTRTRVVAIAFDGPAPMPGVEIKVGEKVLGVMGSAADQRGIAMIRLDRLADARTAGLEPNAGGVPVRVIKPDWAAYDWPA